MAIRIVGVALTPQIITVGQTVLMEVQVSENSWLGIKETLATWQKVKEDFSTWADLKNY